ncbi:biotin/lipoyl-containing protein [Eubacterium ramulus]|uniref:biotin/lipoyl-containing protein n=2 Tax=Eubacterium TaxID=1730 RepID=UPI0022E4A73F|nr:biotin/lipoyl-containing protein [Eubacterium ramulus]
MKSYTITVNGNVYDVTVEENTNGASAAAPAPRAAAPAPAPAAKPAAAAGAAGSISITAGAAGKVVDVVAAPGAAVKKGDPVVVLEIMKMETPVVAPQDGTVASVEVAKGETVESGAVLATMNA